MGFSTMSQRRIKQIRRATRKASSIIVYKSFEDTLALPFRDRLEVCANIITRRRPYLIGMWLVGFVVATLASVVVWLT